ncbi:serine/threonine protein kinase [Tuberibacillus sp. Marseille-P3662]|uniref:serine/threonine protein kinase n=1 Tax=Tuberibacillus sp. Marseille-P3662 TaxID=1965358 RepID=UPI000A1C95FF|nr:hypothetical protein [Tuberibacillus sp. Marseille-P3662]
MTTISLKNQALKIPPGTIVIGKWHQNQYQIIKPLGYGAQGTVYLANSDYGRVALKFGNDNSTITSEVNILKSFSHVQGEALTPKLYDVDDWITNRGTLSFYAMEYINGTSLTECIKVRGFEWTSVFALQLLKSLHRLHEEGWVFGDLKPENLIVTSRPLKVRWLDVGGVTRIGRSIKEYSEFYDRGYWGLGDRKAEPSYDLFAVAMIVIHAATMRHPQKGHRPSQELMTIIRNEPKLLPYETILLKAINGQYSSAADMRHEFVTLISETKTNEQRKPVYGHQPNRSRSKKKKEWKGTLALVLTLTFAYVLYITLFIM